MSISYLQIVYTRINVEKHTVNLVLKYPTKLITFSAEDILNTWNISAPQFYLEKDARYLLLNFSKKGSFILQRKVDKVRVESFQSIRFSIGLEKSIGPFSIGVALNLTSDKTSFFKNFTSLKISKSGTVSFYLYTPHLDLSAGIYNVTIKVYGEGEKGSVIRIVGAALLVTHSMKMSYDNFYADLFFWFDVSYSLSNIVINLVVVPKANWAVYSNFFYTSINYTGSYELTFSWFYHSDITIYVNGYMITEPYPGEEPFKLDPEYPHILGGDIVYGNENYSLDVQFRNFGLFPFKVKSKARWFVHEITLWIHTENGSVFDYIPFNFRFGFVIGKIHDAYLYNWIGDLEKYTFNVTVQF